MAHRKEKLFLLRTSKTQNYRFFMLLLACFALNACASAREDQIIDTGNVIYDPYEDMNRRVMAFNLAVDHTVINPAIKGYRVAIPQPARTGLRNFLRNLRTPVDLLNQVLQGDVEGSGNTALRAAINTTVGVGGLFDVAGHEGIKYEPEDFGQTLAVWGVGHGPYMVVPFIGASSMRDYGGFFADSMVDPLGWYLHNIDEEGIALARFGISYFDLRESLHDTLTDLERNSFDYYAAVRSTYYQHRRALVHDNAPQSSADLPDIPDFDAEDDF